MDMPPIIEKMYEVNLWLLLKTGKFPRDQRFLLGDRLIAKSLAIQDELMAAALTAKENKTRILDQASLMLDQLRYLLRLARDSRSMSRKSWFFCAERLLEIGRMLGGWRKQVEK